MHSQVLGDLSRKNVSTRCRRHLAYIRSVAQIMHGRGAVRLVWGMYPIYVDNLTTLKLAAEVILTI